MRKKLIFLSTVFCVVTVVLVLFYYFYSREEKAQAISSDNTIGWAWSENIGWINMNCYNDYDDDGILESHCTDNGYLADYGVNIDTIGGSVTGEAWSENIGWLQFDPAIPYPAAPNNSAKYDDTTKELSGWAKILTLGVDGWIKLQGPNVAAPANYALCRSCSGVNCDFCYELNVDNGSGKIGTDCNTCAGTPVSCGSCNNTYQYGVSALPYSIKNIGNVYVFEGWAWNDGSDDKNIGWIHFDYAYGNSHLPLPFNNFIVIPAQTAPPSSCEGADLSWEVASWANKYEVKRSNVSASSQDCSVAVYPDSTFVYPSTACTASNCSYQDSTLEENRYYCYKILAWNDTGPTDNSDGSKEVKTTLCSPENFAADGDTCGEINLTWDNKIGETGYKIYRSLTDVDATSSATLIATLGADVTSHKDEDIIPRYTYYYLVTALTAVDESPPAKIFGETLCYKGAEWGER